MGQNRCVVNFHIHICNKNIGTVAYIAMVGFTLFCEIHYIHCMESFIERIFSRWFCIKIV